MKIELLCDHCGDEVLSRHKYVFKDKVFCCNACKMVYQLIVENQLDTFYQLENKSGIRPKNVQQHKYDFLEVEDIRKKFIDFEDENFIKITLFLPEIHCSSCIYLLENLPKLLPAVTSTQVAFIRREALITFRKKELSLSELATFLNKIGYAPNFGNRQEESKKFDKQFFYKLGLAGFAFGSIMLWSFPEYLGLDDQDAGYRNFTSYLSFGVSLPVLFYSARDYFVSAFKALRSKTLNLDVPIALGIIALYAQSCYSIFTNQGPGYMDSFAGFIFFLLIGKWFQNKTYKSLSFDRDYTSYFPVAVTRISENSEEIVEIEQIQAGECILLRNEEVIPCDSILESEQAKIDYSFVTGESEPIYKKKGDFIYAGGKLLGQKAILKAEKASNRSLLTQMWNDVQLEKFKPNRYKFQDTISKYFLGVVLVIAALSTIAWLFIDASRITEIIVAILIVACPCALALSSPFTYGNSMKLMGRKGLFLKNTAVIERMDGITDIVFDKTGTLTESIYMRVDQKGDELTGEELKIIYSLANSSTHPLSRAIVYHLRQNGHKSDLDLENFEEIPGGGLTAIYNNQHIRLGSHTFIYSEKVASNETETYFQVGDKHGKFVFQSELRTGVRQLIANLKDYQLHILSGDKDKDRELMLALIGKEEHLHFNQSPQDKLNYILELQAQGKKVLMVGDGLNDAGALGMAEVGIAVSEDVFRFTPSSDAIIQANRLHDLGGFLKLSHHAKMILRVCLCFSLTYNLVGLSFAVTGSLTPLVAAIIMPLSSVTIVGLSTLLVMLKR